MSGSERPVETPLDERARARGWARRTLYGGGGTGGAAWRGVARPLGFAWRAWADRRLADRRPAERLPAPAIAVGNVTVGGGGKTSLVEWLLGHGLPAGAAAAVLTRGYGREGEGVWVLEPGQCGLDAARAAGDEPALLARRGAWVAVAADRAEAARALRGRVHPAVFLLDDALQHRRVARALDLVAFQAEDLRAAARCVPAGPLRQGPAWLPGLGAWVVVGVDPRELAWPPGSIGGAFGAWWRTLPGTAADWEPAGVVDLATWREGGDAPFRPGDRPVAAFAAVARPESIVSSARAEGLEVTTTLAYPDHWIYRAAHVASILAEHPDAAFLTTEKDAIKLDPAWFGDRPVGVIRRRLAPRDPDLLRELVREAMGSAPA